MEQGQHVGQTQVDLSAVWSKVLGGFEGPAHLGIDEVDELRGTHTLGIVETVNGVLSFEV